MNKEKFEEKMQLTFTLLFEEYKKRLYDLGVPTVRIGDKQLIEWFNNHLESIGQNRRTEVKGQK